MGEVVRVAGRMNKERRTFSPQQDLFRQDSCASSRRQLHLFKAYGIVSSQMPSIKPAAPKL